MRFSSKQVSKALVAARQLLKGPVQPAAKVAAVLSPFMGCTEIQDEKGQLHEELRSQIFATMGDAYRRENNVELAAKWYRRASQISVGTHAPAYAHIVCKHQLADFYEDALRILQEHRRRWKAKSLWTRLILRLCRRTDHEQREIARTEKRDLKFLLEHLQPVAAKPLKAELVSQFSLGPNPLVSVVQGENDAK